MNNIPVRSVWGLQESLRVRPGWRIRGMILKMLMHVTPQWIQLILKLATV